MATFIHTLGPHNESSRVVLAISRLNLQNRHVHFFRFCDRPTMHLWTATLVGHGHMLVWLSAMLETPLFTPHALAVLRVPPNFGGLGFLHPHHEVALHFLQAMLPTIEELPTVKKKKKNPVARQIANTMECLTHETGTPIRPFIAHLAPHRMGHRVRELFSEPQRHMLDFCPWVQPPRMLPARASQPEIPCKWQIRVGMAWYIATPHTFLQTRPLNFAIQKTCWNSIVRGRATMWIYAHDQWKALPPRPWEF